MKKYTCDMNETTYDIIYTPLYDENFIIIDDESYDDINLDDILDEEDDFFPEIIFPGADEQIEA